MLTVGSVRSQPGIVRSALREHTVVLLKDRSYAYTSGWSESIS
jgi:hypothetical protein